MKKIKQGEIFYYSPKYKLTIDDIVEIYHIFKNIDEESKFTINNWELEDVSEINQITKSIDVVNISMNIFGTKGYGGTYLSITDHITLRISDIDDVVLLGLKSKFEAILKNRQNPNNKKSVIGQDNPNQDSANKLMKQEGINKISFFERHKSIIESIIVGIVLLIIGIIVNHFFGLPI